MAYKFNVNPRTAIAGVAGQRVFSRLINGVQSHYIQLHTTMTISITTAVTRIRNKGSAWASWEFIGLDENGRDRCLMDGRVLRYMAEVFAPSALAATRLTTTGTQLLTLEESARLWFAHPLAAAPAETVFKERDPRQTLQLFAQLRADSGTSELVTGGGITVNTTSAIDIEHGYDDVTGELPVFIPSIRQQIVPVASANTQLTEFIKTSNFIRAIIIQQDSDEGEVGDIINALALRADGDDIIGPGQAKWIDLIRGQEAEFGGAVFTTGLANGGNAYLAINFQQNGRLANVVSPALLNLRLEMNVSTSAQTGATNSKVRITIYELERVAGLVTDKIPFAV
jgi:hypothetical protein